MKTIMDSLRDKPIVHHPLPATSSLIAELRANSSVVELYPGRGIHLANEYHRSGLEGSAARVFTRRAIADRLHRIADILSPRYGLCLFDVFRSKRAQAALFERVKEDVRRRHPQWDEEALNAETGKFVADPYRERKDPLPHNTGGAVDLTLTEGDGLAEMGTGFDEPVAASATLFFEKDFEEGHGYTRAQWLRIRGNRRVLFHVMQDAGFANYADEWWHYDLGNGMWGRACGVPWVFDSLEDDVNRLLD